MGKGSSSSSSSTQNQTINEDNRVAGEDGSVVLGKGAGLQINSEFSEEVAGAFKELIGLARDAGSFALQATDRSIDSANKAIDQVAVRAERAEQGNQTIFTDLFPMLALAMIGLVAVTILNNRKR